MRGAHECTYIVDEVVVCFRPPSACDDVDGALTVRVNMRRDDVLFECVQDRFGYGGEFACVVGSYISP